MKKKNVKKNNNKNNIGRNIYGETCIVKEVTIQKKTAIQQYLDIIDDVDAHALKGIRIEYTVIKSKEFTKEESKLLDDMVCKLLSIRAHINDHNFNRVHFDSPLFQMATN